MFQSKNLLFISIQILFFTQMWLSKTIHPLFFEQTGGTLLFGLSYSAMAIAGYFSFVFGYIIDSNLKKFLVAGTLLYAVGLYLRSFPNSFVIAIVSGLLAGVGASLTLAGLRSWMLMLQDEQNPIARLVGLKNSTQAAGTALGCLAAGFLPGLIGQLGYARSLELAAAGMVLVSIVLHLYLQEEKTSEKPLIEAKNLFENLKAPFREGKNLAWVTLLLGAATGFYVSFIAPYLPVILKSKGFSLQSIGLTTAIFSFMRFVIDPWISKFVQSREERKLELFILAEVILLTVTAALLWNLDFQVFFLLLVCRSAFLGLSAITEELIWLERFPKKYVGLFFGLNQSGFLVGDSLGGLINGYLFKNYGMESCILIVVVVMVLNLALFVFFLRYRPQLVTVSVTT